MSGRVAEVISEGSVDRVAFDSGVEFILSDGALVRIEGSGTVGDGAELTQLFRAERPALASLALLGFLRCRVRVLLDDSTLRMESTDRDLRLRVEPSCEFEDWSVVLADGSRLVCAADGEVARWSPSSP